MRRALAAIVLAGVAVGALAGAAHAKDITWGYSSNR